MTRSGSGKTGDPFPTALVEKAERNGYETQRIQRRMEGLRC